MLHGARSGSQFNFTRTLQSICSIVRLLCPRPDQAINSIPPWSCPTLESISALVRLRCFTAALFRILHDALAKKKKNLNNDVGFLVKKYNVFNRADAGALVWNTKRWFSTPSWKPCLGRSKFCSSYGNTKECPQRGTFYQQNTTLSIRPMRGTYKTMIFHPPHESLYGKVKM